ncbi:MAG: diguanylate cyclase [Actinomycetota bacterium]|nr:diguanylate cyclase [Actinomycetota bacterium]
MPFLQENTTWIALGSALAGAAAVAALALVVFYVVSRRKAAGSDLDGRLATSNERLEEKLADLARDLERAQAENRRARELAAIGSTIDLDSIVSRTLEAAAALEFVDAAMIVVGQEDGGPVIATFGMTTDEAARQPIGAPPSGRAARAIEIAYRYAAEDAPGDGELIRGGVVVPLRSDADEAVGTLAVFWRTREREPSESELAALEDLAATAGPAIENGRRFREARKLADLDALTSLHNRRYFHDTLAREVARAHRYDRRLALVVFDIDDFKLINERVGHLAGDSVLAQLADRVRSVVRSADIACRVGGDEFAVILPESALTDAEQLYRRLQFALSARPTGSGERLHLSAGVAELTPEDDAVSFFERADEALFRAKETGKGQAVAAS